MTIKDDYLGDGVYASFDGFAISLDLRGQDSTTKIVLEPSVLDALDLYRKRIAALAAPIPAAPQAPPFPAAPQAPPFPPAPPPAAPPAAPKIIPWTFETCPLPPFTVRNKITKNYCTVTGIVHNGVSFSGSIVKYEELLDEFDRVLDLVNRDDVVACGRWI